MGEYIYFKCLGSTSEYLHVFDLWIALYFCIPLAYKERQQIYTRKSGNIDVLDDILGTYDNPASFHYQFFEF